MLDLIKKLRDQTGVSIAEIKAVLEEAKGDEKKAIELLRARGAMKAEKRAGKETKAGVVEAYIHSNKRLGVLVELLCETDFVARNPQFQELAHEIALQVASMNPQYVSADEITPEVKEHEKEIYREEVVKTGKPANIVEQIVEGKFQKRCQEICLLDQPFIKDQTITIRDLIHDAVAKVGESIKVGKFVRFEV